MSKFCRSESLKQLHASIEKSTGRTIADIRKDYSCQTRGHVQAKTGKPVTATRCFPVIGRGNVLSDCVIDRNQVNELLDVALNE